MSEAKEGWGVIAPGERKAHYYRNGDSLCRRRGFYRHDLDPDDGVPQPRFECAACRKKLDKERLT